MYFANDGGIYRALDGYTGLITGDCGGSNQFDSLNGNLGSHHPGGFFFAASHRSEYDSRRRAGQRLARDQQLTKQHQLGERELGRRRLQPDQSGQSHRLVYRQHRREHPALRFWSGLPGAGFQQRAGGFEPHGGRRFRRIVHAVHPGPAKFRRAAGGHVPDVARRHRRHRIRLSSPTTSRPADTESCNGGEVNLVRALAAGGLKDTAGFSNVMYAGTDGLGPLLPTGGHIWVATNVSGGTGAWVDRTGGTNPSGFPVSGIAHRSLGHHRQDRLHDDHGLSRLPCMEDHRRRRLLDRLHPRPAGCARQCRAGGWAGAGTVYVATDVGVFASGTASPGWTEVGPVPEPGGAAGFLPNVAVTALRMFDFGGTKKLRASTYGRGIWEFTLAEGPNFQFTSPANVSDRIAWERTPFSADRCWRRTASAAR